MWVSWAVHCDSISGCDSVPRPPAAAGVVANYRKRIVLTLMTKDGWRAESAKPPELHEAEKTPFGAEVVARDDLDTGCTRCTREGYLGGGIVGRQQ